MAPDRNDSFDDLDDLDAYLADQRATDTLQLSTVAEAQAALHAFASSSGPGAWASLDRLQVAARLFEIVAVPRSITQGSLNLCGPAAFFSIVAARHPVALAQAAIELFEKGSCSLGGLTLAPTLDLQSASYSEMQRKSLFIAPQADWMLLGALRNSTEVFWQPSWRGDPNQELAGMTRPEELAGWLQATGYFSSVVDGGRWASNPGLPDAEALAPEPGVDHAMLINVNMLAAATGNTADQSFLLNMFPNHWVVLVSEVVPDAVAREVRMSVWTWGRTFHSLLIPEQLFQANYFGAVTTRLKVTG